MKRCLKALGACLLLAALLAGGYVVYLFATYDRLEDFVEIEVVDGAQQALRAGEEYTAVTWNLGFGAYSDDYSFFMDGGTQSRAYSGQAVCENIAAAIETLKALEADVMLLQEVDVDATRSYHVDQRALIRESFAGYDEAFAQNYDSAYLFYPLLEPHGASRAGQITLSAYQVDSALRRSLPVETGLMKLFDLDRCYSVARLPVENGRTLCLYNLHFSAYTSDGSIADTQLEMLAEDMKAELAAGNYVIAGGDFNKDLLGNSSEVFGVSGEEYTWAQPLKRELVPEGFTLVSSLNADAPVPSCRNADRAYEPGVSFVLTVDGFIVSDNVRVSVCRVEDEGFAVSDHNPVVLRFCLEE